MAYWQNNAINNIFTGLAPNDGTGDDIRTSFTKVDTNFANIAAFLASTESTYYGANIGNLIADLATVTGLTATTATVDTQTVSGNITAANVNAGGLHSTANTTLSDTTVTGAMSVNGFATFNSNVYITGTLIPTTAGIDLGTPDSPFGNVYGTIINTTQVAATSDAGLLQIHANAAPGDVKDVGVFGNVSHHYGGANNYAFFGYQNSSGNFVYKNTTVNTASGNNIVTGGVYGNVQFGSQWISNTTPATNTTSGAFVVAGGAGIAGNVYAGNVVSTVYGNVVSSVANISAMTVANVAGRVDFDSNIFVRSSQVITAATLQSYGVVYSGGVIAGVQAFVNGTQSTSTSTGAVIVPSGGMGVGGNIVAGGFVGPHYGAVLTSNQPNITGLGTIGNLIVSGSAQAGSIGATTISVTDLTATGITSITNLTGLSTLSLGGNITAGGFVGSVYGLQGNITSVGTLSGLTVSGNTAINNTVYGRGVYDNGTRVVSSSSGSGNLVISAGGATLATHGPGVVTTGSGTAIPVITTDLYGRVTSISTQAIAATLSTAGSSGSSGTVALASQSLSFAGTNGITATASGSTITIAPPQNLQTAASPTFAGLTLSGTLLPNANVAVDIGSTSMWFNNYYGTAVHAKYADLAEKYIADKEYEAGTVVVVGGEKEVTACATGDFVIGVVSTNPAYMMNSELEGGTFIALKGRVPVRVYGPVKKGQRLVAGDWGCATAITHADPDTFGIALETNTELGLKTIEAVIL